MQQEQPESRRQPPSHPCVQCDGAVVLVALEGVPSAGHLRTRVASGGGHRVRSWDAPQLIALPSSSSALAATASLLLCFCWDQRSLPALLPRPASHPRSHTSSGRPCMAVRRGEGCMSRSRRTPSAACCHESRESPAAQQTQPATSPGASSSSESAHVKFHTVYCCDEQGRSRRQQPPPHHVSRLQRCTLEDS